MTSERFYGPEGFTDPIIGALKYYGLFKNEGRGIERFEGMPAEVLTALAERFTEETLEEQQNNGPSVRAFLALAQADPFCTFEGYVVTHEREDERFIIDGVTLPQMVEPEQTALVPYLPADEDEDLVNGSRRLWWD